MTDKKNSEKEIIAKKDWIIVQNKFRFVIKKDKPLPQGIPSKLMVALKTEQVI